MTFRVPPRVTVAGRVRMVRRSGDPAFPRADIALSDFRIEPGGGEATVLVHNIGNVAARIVHVALLAGGKEIGSQTIPLLEAPNDLAPMSVLLRFYLRERPDALECVATVDQREICISNNRAALSVAY